MPGSFTFDPPPAPLTGDATLVQVYRLDSANQYSHMPNIQCDSIVYREGAEVPVARFHYVLDDTGVADDWPSQWEQILRLSAIKIEPGHEGDTPEDWERYIVFPDDELVVIGFTPKGKPRLLFDGFAQAPQGNVGDHGQVVQFTASGVAIRLFDEPIHERLERNGDAPETEGVGNRVWVDGHSRFNPKIQGQSRGNCTPDNHNENPDDEDASFPIFLDPLIIPVGEDKPKATFFTLNKIARYLMGAKNGEEEWVENPDFSMVDRVLKGRRPKEGLNYFDPDDPESCDEEDIVIPEWDPTGKEWPKALESLLESQGFAMKFGLDQTADGLPRNYIDLYRKDGSSPYGVKEINYQQHRGDLSPDATNVSSIGIVRDYKDVANAVVVDTALDLVEISVILWPLFQGEDGDQLDTTAISFTMANLKGPGVTAIIRNKYRLWGADECGEGHYSMDGSWTIGDDPFDFAKLWPDKDDLPQYVRRRRPGRGTLVSKDSAGKPRKATLAISRDYAGEVGVLWDGSGTWQEVSGGWDSLPDRLGVYLKMENLERWSLGDSDKDQAKSKVLRVITSLVAPDSTNRRFFLRYTTVIEGDKRAVPLIARRNSSPLKYQRIKYSNTRDDFGNQFVHTSSPYADKATDKGEKVGDGMLIPIRDDRDRVKNFGGQVQRVHESVPLTGPIEIPYTTNAFTVGDQISRVNGRDISFTANLGSEQGEGPRYPYVVSYEWSFSGDRQTTVLQLSDRRGEPKSNGRR